MDPSNSFVLLANFFFFYLNFRLATLKRRISLLCLFPCMPSSYLKYFLVYQRTDTIKVLSTRQVVVAKTGLRPVREL